MPIRWSTFITDADGVVDYSRVRSLVSIGLAVLGALVLVAGAVMEIAKLVPVPFQYVLIVSGVLVIPVTGGQIGDWMGKHLQASAVAKAVANAQAPEG